MGEMADWHVEQMASSDPCEGCDGFYANTDECAVKACEGCEWAYPWWRGAGKEVE